MTYVSFICFLEVIERAVALFSARPHVFILYIRYCSSWGLGKPEVRQDALIRGGEMLSRSVSRAALWASFRYNQFLGGSSGGLQRLLKSTSVLSVCHICLATSREESGIFRILAFFYC